MFCARQKEMDTLDALYASQKFEFAVIYGRRRVGKTTLINHFCKNKNAIFFTGVETSSGDNLDFFSKSIFENTKTPSATFNSFDALLEYFDTAAQKERLVLVIDEYPYLAKSEPSFPSLLQKHIDHKWKNSKIFLILCGSSLSFMENQVLGAKSPIYGRKTAQLKIEPFNFFDSREMIPGFDPQSQAILYGATWGVPEYINHVQQAKSLDENLTNLFFNSSGRLFEEPSNLFKQEFRSPATSNSVVKAIAQGASKMNDIATRTGLETSAVSGILDNLMELGIVKKETPVTEKENSRKSIYSVSDLMFRFWFYFVSQNVTHITRSLGAQAYKNFAKPSINEYMGRVFETICMQFLTSPKGLQRLPFFPEKIGRWWGTNSKKKQEEEIDIVCLNENQVVACECKWTNKLVDSSVLDCLVEKSLLLPATSKSYILFGKSGFAKNCIEKAKTMGNVQLITLKEMAQA
ncbi:MAG: ATP-binding protein [Fibrobacter sp.]|nr:ATP-binding protein [Fibrobacter sp.]